MAQKNTSFDCVVIGLGGVGSAAAYHLARLGKRVLGLDRFSPPHAFGSSHGETRIIRKAYFEHPSYVPLLCRAYELWRSLEIEYGRQLYHQTGIIGIGPSNGVVVPGVQRSAAQFNLPIESLSMAEVSRRYPMLRGDAAWSAVVEQDAGYLLVEDCVEAHLKGAAAAGATLLMEQTVVDWQADDSGVTVTMADATYHADRLIVTAGPWAEEWLWKYGVPLTVLRKHVYWFETDDDSYSEKSGFPCVYFETPDGDFYTVPQREGSGLKVARHSGGTKIGTVASGDHEPDASTQEAVESFVFKHLPGVSQRIKHWSGCYYTMTPDEHFIVDRLPRHPNVTVVAGLSGHGFKFTSVLGEIAAAWAMDQQVNFDLGCFQINRFL